MGCANLHPLDAALRLPVERASHGVRRLAAIEATRGSFADAVVAIERACGLRVGKLVVEQLALRAAVDIDRFYRRTDPVGADAEVPLALSFDAKGIVMLPKDLREDTRKAAEAKQDAGGNAMKTRLAAGEKNGRKRMAVLGAAWDSPAAPRTIDDVITDPDARPIPAASVPTAPGPATKWLTGSVADTIADVVSAAFDQAEDRDPGHERDRVVLVDGAERQARHRREDLHLPGEQAALAAL